MRPVIVALAALAFLHLATAAAAQCSGRDLRPTLSPTERAEVDAAVAATPHAAGNHWRATRGDLVIHLVGTVHLDDPSLAAPVERLRPVIAAADRLFLEMTPEDETGLQQALATQPDLLLLQDTTLPELMEEEAWQALAEAARARGLPAVMAAKFQPWYLSMLLSVPPCAAQTITEGQGFDKRLAALATEEGTPMASLEPYQTIFDKFAGAPMEEQLQMLESALVDPETVEDMFATLIASYLDEATVEGWEISRILSRRSSPLPPSEVDAAYDVLEQSLLTDRNADWMPVILGDGSPRRIVVAAGAAHLPGRTGLLQLLADRGFTLERLPF